LSSRLTAESFLPMISPQLWLRVSAFQCRKQPTTDLKGNFDDFCVALYIAGFRRRILPADPSRHQCSAQSLEPFGYFDRHDLLCGWNHRAGRLCLDFTDALAGMGKHRPPSLVDMERRPVGRFSGGLYRGACTEAGCCINDSPDCRRSDAVLTCFGPFWLDRLSNPPDQRL
jgi:hypothetical protein